VAGVAPGHCSRNLVARGDQAADHRASLDSFRRGRHRRFSDAPSTRAASDKSVALSAMNCLKTPTAVVFIAKGKIMPASINSMQLKNTRQPRNSSCASA